MDHLSTYDNDHANAVNIVDPFYITWNCCSGETPPDLSRYEALTLYGVYFVEEHMDGEPGATYSVNTTDPKEATIFSLHGVLNGDIEPLHDFPAHCQDLSRITRRCQTLSLELRVPFFSSICSTDKRG